MASTGNKVFAPAIFFIAFRESLEASLVIGILTGMLERIVGKKREEMDPGQRKLIKKLRIYVVCGALTGLLIAAIIGAVCLAVFYTSVSQTDVYGSMEELWEGILNLIAVILITPMSLAILQADKSRVKWRKKLAKAFAGIETMSKGKEEMPNVEENVAERTEGILHPEDADSEGHAPLPPVEKVELDKSSDIQQFEKSKDKEGVSIWRLIRRPFDGEAKGATAIFLIPLITTAREGLEAIVFIGGVSLGLPASSIPLPAIVGLIVGFLVGYLCFRAKGFSKMKPLLVTMTCCLLVISAGMFSRSVYYLEFYQYVKLVGDAATEGGNSYGTYDARNYVWHLDCCNPEDKTDNGGSGWSIFNTLVGWNNTATIGSLTSYCLYWVAIVAIVAVMWVNDRRTKEGKKPLVSKDQVKFWKKRRVEEA
ncbi:hypothetical protein MBRA1_003679 [Malassezia brasiliensis]|uniref:Plasma membrane iron permease n=1 Tax=Malassezia brasiliensis TaxID=1821822 RepID=A0AAF0DX49_9BASI|nr:hypothetical protein MBRA1_003679 [Malassezia brasiliensis]